MDNVWDFKATKYGPAANRVRHPLTLGWALDGESLSDLYTVADADAKELFSVWLDTVDVSGDLTIQWWLPELGERAPFQDDDGRDSFFDFYDWPVHSDRLVPVNWMSLPVQDKRWNKSGGDSGGFIQEATGWKPSPLQRTVHMPTLLKATRWR